MYVATDLHGHTRFSDGRATPEEYVDLRRELGMRVIAITDHDVFTGVRRGAAAASAAGLVLVPAAEITAFFHFGERSAEQVHVLAYFSPDVLVSGRLERTFLYRRGQRVQQKWRDFVMGWLSSLPRDARDALDPDMELGRLPTAEFPALQTMIDRIVLRARPLYEPFRDHHVRFWEGDRETFGWTPEEAIEAIRGDGAIDVVAHPARYRDKEATAAPTPDSKSTKAVTAAALSSCLRKGYTGFSNCFCLFIEKIFHRDLFSLQLHKCCGLFFSKRNYLGVHAAV